MDTLLKIGSVALVILGGLIVILGAIAPLTKTDSDNWVLSKLQALRDLLAKLIGAKVAAPSDTPKA